MKTRTAITELVAASQTAFTAVATPQSVDRTHEPNPNCPPSATKDTEVYHPERVGIGPTPCTSTRLRAVSDLPNSFASANRSHATNRKTTPHDFAAYRKDEQPGGAFLIRNNN